MSTRVFFFGATPFFRSSVFAGRRDLGVCFPFCLFFVLVLFFVVSRRKGLWGLFFCPRGRGGVAGEETGAPRSSAPSPNEEAAQPPNLAAASRSSFREEGGAGWWFRDSGEGGAFFFCFGGHREGAGAGGKRRCWLGMRPPRPRFFFFERTVMVVSFFVTV
jgi:hypothetical protein